MNVSRCKVCWNHSRSFGVALCVVVLLLVSVKSGASPVLNTKSAENRWNLGPFVDYLEEGPQELDLDALLSGSLGEAFIPLNAETLNLGIRGGACWFRFRVANRSSERTTYYVEVDNSRIKQADFYVPDREVPDFHQRAGTSLPFRARSMPYRNCVFRLTLEPGEETVAYLRVHHRGSYRFNIVLWEVDAFIHHHTLRTGLYGMFYGALLIMFVFNVILSILFRERSYIFLSAFIASVGLATIIYQRIDAQYIWPDATGIPGSRLNVMVGLGLCAAILFTREFLETARNLPRWDKLYRVYAVLCLLVCLDLVVESFWTDWLLQIMGGTAPILMLIGAVMCIRKGNRYAWGYLVAWGGVFVTMVAFALMGVGVLSQSFLAEHAIQIAFPLALSMSSIALWQRFRELQDKHTANLDQLVSERTHELTQALENVKTLHGLIPICSACKNVRDDEGFWIRVETYIQNRSDADFTHGLCPECAMTLYNFDTEQGKRVAPSPAIEVSKTSPALPREL